LSQGETHSWEKNGMDEKSTPYYETQHLVSRDPRNGQDVDSTAPVLLKNSSTLIESRSGGKDIVQQQDIPVCKIGTARHLESSFQIHPALPA